MRKRLDQLLVDKQLAPTRSRARDVIRRGFVTVDGHCVEKAGATFDINDEIALQPGAGLDYVSRGALKLLAAMEAFQLEARDRIVLDVGASTGGFTDVVLQAGARKVYSVDVGRDQLHPRLASDPRVVVKQELDIREIDHDCGMEPVDAIVCDVSFISLTKALPRALDLAKPGAWLVALIKPQFEVGPSGVSKDGVVKDETLRTGAVKRISAWLDRQQDWHVRATMPSPLSGQSGNLEFLIHAARHV